MANTTNIVSVNHGIGFLALLRVVSLGMIVSLEIPSILSPLSLEVPLNEEGNSKFMFGLPPES